MKATEKSDSEVVNEKQLFTDFNGKFKARLSAVIPSHFTTTSENAPISSKYDCRIKLQYHKDIMSLLEEGMVLAVKNFKNKLEDNKEHLRYTLLVVSKNMARTLWS